VTPVACLACGTENEPGRKFCGECGNALARSCPSCGAPNPASVKFCGECGAQLASPAEVKPPTAAPQAERRHVTVLFADLVGFTTLSESRDAEEVRELLSRYFDTARTVIDRYGGTVEKFIGDAVMALWGAPVANEDDAERAVRAGLELVDEVAALGAEIGAPALRLRGGVLTGEAAVTIGAEGQGMVAGDLVNTASRIQSVADPGTVLVGDTTLRASQAAIVYEDAGRHELKGKNEPVQLWRALRVIAARRGEGRSTGLEAPFVGRERELRMVKDLFHATAGERRAHLLSVVGVPGIGKSRMAWEFEKYIDGLAEAAWWQRGRCLAYGEGVAYWALAEMVRMRARIAEDEEPESALAKLRASIEEIVLDSEEQAFVEPRLQHLLGLTERTAPDKTDLFSAWRLFIERMTDQDPVILIFEDIHWADAALLEFIEYLMDWSRNHPIFVLTLSRPDVGERHAAWSARIRSFTSLQLEPLDNADIDRLLRGLVPGLPADALQRILERADGIPLYAVETVRMLFDRGLVEPAGAGYLVTGDLTSLDIPETLHALVAARLDGLEPEERHVLQHAAVLGKTFAPKGLAAVSGLEPGVIRPLLDGLVRKELLFLETDPRSPERGQYGFVQALAQRVAYETLGRRDRKACHVAAARYLAEEAGIDADEIAEVIAAHYLDALAADESADDATEIRGRALGWLERAGERAMSLAAADDARRAFESAAGLADDSRVRAALLEQAGNAARMAFEPALAESLLTEARDLHTAAGDTHSAARAAAGLARALWLVGRTSEAISLAEEAYAALGSDEPDEAVATLAAELGRLHYFTGELDIASARLDEALDIAEAMLLPSVLSNAMNTKALISTFRHPSLAHALLRESLAIALDHDLTFDALRSYNNLLVLLDRLDRMEDIESLIQEARELARRRGDREWEDVFACYTVEFNRIDGRWDEALELAGGLVTGAPDVSKAHALLTLAEIHLERGHASAATDLVESVGLADEPTDRQWRSANLLRQRVRAAIAGDADGEAAASAESVERWLEHRESDLYIAEEVRWLAAALPAASDSSAADAVLEALRASAGTTRPTRQLTAQHERLEGVVASLRGAHDDAIAHFALALAAARSVRVLSSFVAEILVDYAEALTADGRADDAAPLLAEARAFYDGVGAVRTLARIDALADAAPAKVPS
jgi:predicted ATPase/class 3 adenylate cyclase